MTRIIAMILAGLMCSAAAEAADWKPYAGDRYFSYYYDAKRISYPYKTILNVLNLELAKLGIVNVWTRRVIKDESGREWQVREQKREGFTTKGYDRYEYTVARVEMNCPKGAFRVLSEADYSKDGEVLSSFSKEARFADWNPVAPDSQMEALHYTLCKQPEDKRPDLERSRQKSNIL